MRTTKRVNKPPSGSAPVPDAVSEEDLENLANVFLHNLLVLRDELKAATNPPASYNELGSLLETALNRS
jgi:hypothetical protein